MKKSVLSLGLILLAAPLVAQNATSSNAPAPGAKADWRPQLLFGGVNFQEQLAQNPAQWHRTAARMDGMLLHLHFWVRNMRVPDNAKIENADAIKRGIAPALRGKTTSAPIARRGFHLRAFRR